MQRAALNSALDLDLPPCFPVSAQELIAGGDLIEEHTPLQRLGGLINQLTHRTTGCLRQLGEAIPGRPTHSDGGAHSLSLQYGRLNCLPDVSLAPSVGVGLGVVHELMESEVKEVGRLPPYPGPSKSTSTFSSWIRSSTSADDVSARRSASSSGCEKKLRGHSLCARTTFTSAASSVTCAPR
jgi:hypothetical protein